jgi:hypothetical protein
MGDNGKKVMLCLTKHHAMKMYGGVEVDLHPSRHLLAVISQRHAPIALIAVN